MGVSDRGPDGKFLAGNCANPRGRPPKPACVTDNLRRLLAETLRGDSRITHAEALARVLLTEALRGDRHAIREVLDRVEGRPVQAIVGVEDADVLRIIRSPVPVPDHLRGATLEDLGKDATDGPGDGC
jgi:hypothetical protein